MTTTFDRHPLPVVERFRNFVDSLAVIPPFSADVVTEDFASGYSAGRSDIGYAVDSEITGILGVYEVLDVASALFDGEALGEFLTARVTALDDRTPIEALLTGDSSDVLALLASEYEGQVR